MIPSSDTYGVPGAGDEMIFADIVRSLGCDADHVTDVLAEVDAISGGCDDVFHTGLPLTKVVPFNRVSPLQVGRAKHSPLPESGLE